jgi:signal transduction histidine kinase
VPQGLPRKVRIAFLLQVVTVSLAVVACGWLIAAVIKHGYVQNASQAEADDFFAMRGSDPAFPVPQSYYIDGWFVPAGVGTEGVPERLVALPPGYHELSQAEMVRVDRRRPGTLYLVYDRDRVDTLLYSFAVLPVAVALLAVFAVSWLTYRVSRRLIAPVNWLAREVARWDPRHPDVSALAPENLPADVDGSEAQQLARALHVLGRRVEALVARERNFTRDASHELRTPLTVIRMGSDLLLADEAQPPRARRSLERIQRAGRDMEAVIDAFLILAREAEVEPLSTDFAVADVVAEQVERVRQSLGRRPVEVRVSGDAAPVLHAPPQVLHVMLGNLLDNAMAHTDAGTIEVRIERDRVVVRDTGEGMSEEQLQRSFDPFYRPSADNGAPASGIGLSIVQRLGDRFDWPVSLESRPGQGTTATIEFGAAS